MIVKMNDNFHSNGFYVYILLGILGPFLILWKTFFYYLVRRNRYSWFVVTVALISWSLPMCVLLLLPLDLSSTLYRQCLSNSNFPDCDLPLVFLSENALRTIWRAVYWTSFLMTWVFFPLLIALGQQPCCRLSDKIKLVLKSHLQRQIVFATIGLGIITYLIFAHKFTTQTLLSLLMLLSNVYGLVLVVLFMGQGLMQIPKDLWLYASPRLLLKRKLYPQAPAARESFLDAETLWRQVSQQVCDMFHSTVPAEAKQEWHDAILVQRNSALQFSFCKGVSPVVAQLSKRYALSIDQEWVCQLAIYCYAEVLQSLSTSQPYESDVTLDDLRSVSLRKLHKQVTELFVRYDKARARWHRLLLQIWWLEDCSGSSERLNYLFWRRRDGLDNPGSIITGDNRFSFSKSDANARAMAKQVPFVFKVVLTIEKVFVNCFRMIVYRGAAILCGLVSATLLWSEVTFPFTTSNSLTDPENAQTFKYNLLAWAMSWLAKGANVLDTNVELGRLSLVQIASLLIIAYMCLCSFASLVRLRIFVVMSLQGPHHSDENSMLFVGTILCRIMFPLCWNFLMMIGDQEHTEFTKFMGKSNLLALLGSKLQMYLPVGIAIFFIVSLFNLHQRLFHGVKAALGTADSVIFFYEELDDSDETQPLLPSSHSRLEVGQRLAKRERKLVLQKQQLLTNQLDRKHKRQHSQDVRYNKYDEEKPESVVISTGEQALKFCSQVGGNDASLSAAASVSSETLDEFEVLDEASAKLWEW